MKTMIVTVLALAIATGVAAEGSDVAITVYNRDLALVKDVRTINLDEGVSYVRFSDVAARIDPTSVHFKVLDGEPADVWEQNYQFDLASSSKILNKYLEQVIDVITEDADLFSGTLVSVDGSSIVLDEGRGRGPIVTLNREKVAYIRFPALPEGLISKPTLVWKMGAERGGERTIEVTYMTSSVNWHAEYVGVANEDDTELDLAAWVSIDNRSGATYRNAGLDLVAGDVRTVQQPQGDMVMRSRGAKAAYEEAPEFEQEQLFEYYLYKLDTRTDVADQEIKQLTFFPSTNVAVKKVLEFDSWKGSDVRAMIVFENSEEAGIGRPLPAGKVRMYKEDSAGSLQFIGEDRIDHTPKNEDVKLYLGNAFDVKAERVQTDATRISDRVRDESYRVSIRNHKDDNVVVRVVEHLSGYWEITASSHEYEKKDSRTIEFEIPVPADGETVLTYTARRGR